MAERELIPELGHLALNLALAVALMQATVPLFGASTGNVVWMRTAMATSITQFALLSIAFAALMRSFVVSDFSVMNVAQNSSVDKPLLFKISGTWGSHEGSLLLWVVILSLFGALVAVRGGNIPLSLKARTLSIQAWISVGFLSFMLFTSNPFERLYPAPLEGKDLNPLLQDVGLALHPPFLYLGYVGFSIVFSFAVAALIEGRVDPAWARWVRPWTLAAWMFLTAGIALGSWWAYYELGWGGWWFWDPVENVSFMPWLMGTALLHSAIVTEKRNTFKSWTILLAILTFSLSLLGTFIVRSGLLTSVHAFAVDPERGLYILALLAISIVGPLIMFAFRASAMERGGTFAPISRESGLMINNVLLAVATGTVLFGTLYPLFLEAVDGTKISVGPPYFNATFVPLMLPLIVAMGVGPFLTWKRAKLREPAFSLSVAAGISITVSLIVWYQSNEAPFLAIVSIAAATWLGITTLVDWSAKVKLLRGPLRDSIRRIQRLPRSSHGMAVAHLGIAFCILGFVGSSAFKTEEVIFASVETPISVAGYELKFLGVQEVKGPNYVADRAQLVLVDDKELVTNLFPERRRYGLTGTSTTESAIYSTIAGDVYVTIGRPSVEQNADKWTLRVIYEPLVGFIWFGALMLVFAGFLSLSDRRFRIGAPRRKSIDQAKISLSISAEQNL